MLWRNLGLVALFLLGVLLMVMLFLRWYTHHGQSLVLPDYTGQVVEVAARDAQEKSFQIRVVDSVFLVGKEGGIIVDQNPKADSQVKQKRKIYVTVTKEAADKIPLGRLPVLYGKSYDRKQKELKQGFEINTKIVGRKYDAGAPDHILEVIYKGETVVSSDVRMDDVLIEKGGMLEMILSKESGGSLDMPNLICKSYDEVLFQLQTLNLVVGEEEQDGTVNNIDAAYIYDQEPSPESRVYTGDTIKIYLTQNRPDDCDEN
ncbi:MAG: PASTA domain-containing protein [Saprospiraceae bacterium]|nr:PASTA domain-containing protein [Saprospiraceae bacterium]